MRRTQRPNRPSWTHGQKPVTVPGIAEQMSSLVIPDGFALVVRAKPDNTNSIYLGATKALAESATDRIPYSTGNGLSLWIKNADQVWVDAAVAGEGVDFWVEQ
ncbi:hypothetical protein LCGC14_1751140 [marine sediment metagenome]|uniref:Uncharacterized protein n=1 Tax=marine sediment metagenome TaxID=412755 RepID=A0A0F9K393_9ZZZZ